MFNWAFKTAENVVKGAVNITAPVLQRLDKPIQLADQTLVKGIDKLEVKAPIIKEQPQEIYNQAKCKVIERVQPHINKVCSFRMAGQQKAATLKELSWAKANEVLATQYGTMAVSGVDSTAVLAERLLDYYFPRAETDIEEDSCEFKEFLIDWMNIHSKHIFSLSPTFSSHFGTGRSRAAHSPDCWSVVEQDRQACVQHCVATGEAAEEGGRARIRGLADCCVASDPVLELYQ